MPGADAGSDFSQISVREKANKQVRSRYLVLMEKIPNTVQESDYLMILEDLKAKLSADSFEHFISIAKELAETHGTLEKFEDTDHFFNTAVLQGWEGNEGDVETDVSKAILLQQDRVISSLLISKLGKWQSLALTYPISTVGRSCFLLGTLFIKLQPRTTSGLSAEILWGLLDQLLTLETEPSRLNMEVWISKIDLHIISMDQAGQKPSDNQIVGRILSQLQRFTNDRWSMRGESISASMIISESKTWDSLKSRILEFSREDAKLKRMEKEATALYLEQNPKNNSKGKGGYEKPPYKSEKAPYNKSTCTYCSKQGHTSDVCRKKMFDQESESKEKIKREKLKYLF